MVKVRNVSLVGLCVNIVHKETKQLTQVNIQPKGKVTLPEGFVVEPNYYVRHKSELRVINKD